MVKLPNYEMAVVSRKKVADYLLSPSHPWGRHKASFFATMGFSPRRWEEMAAVLKRHGASYEAARIEATPFGTNYVVQGIMVGRNGRAANVRTVWFVPLDEVVPRFVTAYPIRGVR